jgi:hypothetical protein
MNIETPEEFAHAVIGIVRTITIRNGEEWTPYDQIKQMLTVRDAAIRAECAERAIECLKNNYQDWPNIITGMHQLRAAIMGEQ